MIYKNCILLWRTTQKSFNMMAKVKGEKFDFKLREKKVIIPFIIRWGHGPSAVGDPLLK